MTPLKRTIIEKVGHDYGFEHVLPAVGDVVYLGSARHPALVTVSLVSQGFVVQLEQGPVTLPPELDRSFANWPRIGHAFVAPTEEALAQWLRRVAALALALPNQAAVDFEVQVQQALKALPAADIQSTEVQRMVRQRLGQDRYRQAMLAYWGGACAVTGLALQPALRASHAKPWADCQSDAERLDVFNGFLLSANLDALFDRFLISFTDAGDLLISAQVSANDRLTLGLCDELKLRWATPDHIPYLEFHRNRFENL